MGRHAPIGIVHWQKSRSHAVRMDGGWATANKVLGNDLLSSYFLVIESGLDWSGLGIKVERVSRTREANMEAIVAFEVQS